MNNKIKEGAIVRINIPNQAPFVKSAAAKRQYNHKNAKVTELVGEKCRLNLDGGYYLWEPEILCPATPKKC